MDVLSELPLNEAATLTVAPAEGDPAVAENVAVVESGNTDTEGGAVSRVLSLDRITLAPPSLETATVQVLESPVLRAAAEQVSDVSAGGAQRAILVDCVEVLIDAVTVTA